MGKLTSARSVYASFYRSNDLARPRSTSTIPTSAAEKKSPTTGLSLLII